MAISTEGSEALHWYQGCLSAASTMKGPLQISAEVGKPAAEAQPHITGKVKVWLKQVVVRLTASGHTSNRVLPGDTQRGGLSQLSVCNVRWHVSADPESASFMHLGTNGRHPSHQRCLRGGGGCDSPAGDAGLGSISTSGGRGGGSMPSCFILQCKQWVFPTSCSAAW